MAKDPSFPFYASDWLGSNKRAMMTLKEQGAYVVLLCRQWTDPTCSLPDDDGVLAELSGLGEGWLEHGSAKLRACFEPHSTLRGRIANARLLEIRSERDEWRAKSVKGGKKSGAARRAKSKAAGVSGKANQMRTKPPTKPPTNSQPKANTPSPSPSPLPPTVEKLKQKTDRSDDVLAVITHYRTYHPQALNNPTKNSKEWKLIWARIVEGSTVETLCAAIDGCHRTPHNMGQNEQNQKYLGLALIMRDDSQVQRFIEATPHDGMSEMERRSVAAGKLYLKQKRNE